MALLALEGIPQGCHVWQLRISSFCATLFAMENPAPFRFDVICHIWPVLCSLSLLRFPPREFAIPLNQNKLPMKPDESVNPLFPPPYSHPIPSFFTQYYVFQGSLEASFSSRFFFFFQVGYFFQHPLCLLFLASQCFPVVTPYFESCVVVLVKLAGAWGWCADSRRVKSSGIILKRLVAQGLNFKNKVAVKVAHKYIRNGSILEMAAVLA